MKLAVIKALLAATLTLQLAVLQADEAKQVSYEPAVVTLTGTIIEEGYGDDPAPIDRGKRAWILHLAEPISVPAKPGDEIDTEEKNVREVHLNLAEVKRPLPKVALGKTRFSATGTLYHAHTVHHLRPIVMMVSELKPAKTKTYHD
jgi:Domain of unknown function (DUF4431)